VLSEKHDDSAWAENPGERLLGFKVARAGLCDDACAPGSRRRAVSFAAAAFSAI
jgi:hypothetical protein